MVLNIKEFEELKKDLQVLMGNNFLDPLVWQVNYGMVMSDSEKSKMANFPWSLEFLNSDCPFEKGLKIYQSHFLFWASPVNLSWFINRFPDYLNPKYLIVAEKNKERFLQEKLKPSWYLMPIRSSFLVDDQKISFTEHLKMVPANYELASAVEETARQIFIKERIGKFASGLFLYPTEIEDFYFNSLYKKDKSLKKFVWARKSFELARVLMIRSSDFIQLNRNIVLTSLDEVQGISIVSLGESDNVLPLALSLKRKY